MSTLQEYATTSPGSGSHDSATLDKAVRQAADAGRSREEAADLVRAEGGYTVTCTYWPTLRCPTGATVTVVCDGRVLDRLEVLPSQAYAVWAHTAFYSEPYAAALRPERPVS